MNSVRFPTALAVLLALLPAVASAQPAPHHHRHRPPPPPPAVAHWDRHHVGWWRGHPWFAAYRGPRHGYYFAPGHGYYAVPRAYWGRHWTVGVVVPPPLRRYTVVDLRFYRLAVPPRGHTWIYLDTNIALIRISSGAIVRVVDHVW
ncbi:RcnB family protein [Sphingomonas sanxanigenens]|uniref:Integral membrane protein n=1 Tax=Sphingomonas sanxanigenens DSM 19645 = NX02 TaxID=1123269 RepID=W0AFZ2_9SPHN|nr:RcnB family protein [Sphingomonas sanxanigenens]AHE56834.1 hypothetical protein NX02_26185 [Sphingomonas sanxanigenens DSM 19645 = NX02]